MESLALTRLAFSSVCTAAPRRFLPFLGLSSRASSPVRASKGPRTGKSSRGGANAGPKRKGSHRDNATRDRKGADKGGDRRSPAGSGPRRAGKPKDRVSPAPAVEDARILLSGAMPVELEEVLQTGEPAGIPLWQTFASSLCGVWRGVGAAFSPTTAEMEAIALGSKDEMLYDCRISSTIEECKGSNTSHIQRKTLWAVGNPLGEQGKQKLRVQEPFMKPQQIDYIVGSNMPTVDDLDDEILEDSELNYDLVEYIDIDNDFTEESDLDVNLVEASSSDAVDNNAQLQNSSSERVITDLESPNLVYDSVMEEDQLGLEPGLVFFEDGSYSRGPLTLLDGDSPAYQFEQCLVRGGHTRLRIVHTISVEDDGESIQLLRVAVYNEEWMGPHDMKSISDTGGHHLKLFSQHQRLKPQELIGSWKVFEMSATPIFGDDVGFEQAMERPPYFYMSTEIQKRRLLPECPVLFADEDILDMQDVTIMWLPGGISAYVDVKDDGTLTIGVGWYENGINLVMERDYNKEGKLSEIHSKSEVKGGWVGGRM